MIANAMLVDQEATGKRHQSFYFKFQVLEALQGHTSDSVFTSQEIYWDFGGRQILDKTGDEGEIPVTIKYRCKSDLAGDGRRECQVVWVTEMGRKKSMPKKL